MKIQKDKNMKVIIPLISLFVLISLPAHADSIVFDFDQANSVLAGENNAGYIDIVQSSLGIRGNSQNFLYKTYRSFDISTLPDSATVTSATISFWANGAADVAENAILYGIKDGVTNEDFDEGTITYANAPGNSTYDVSGTAPAFVGDNIGMNASDTVSLGTLGTSVTSSIQGNKQVYSVTFSGAALDFINNDTNNNVTFAISPNAGLGVVDFFTEFNAETGLALTYAIPEPGSISLMLIGFSGLIGLLRRRR
ncbi:DNRLRE domain-containing protein [Kiritimatiellota bacterium B12222]|nr:DNRLRE domain-containing protein [Kiritimatiellota bacterium B12222]